MIAATAMADVHAGLHRLMMECLALSADDARAVIDVAMSELEPLDETFADSVTLQFEGDRTLP